MRVYFEKLCNTHPPSDTGEIKHLQYVLGKGKNISDGLFQKKIYIFQNTCVSSIYKQISTYVFEYIYIHRFYY